MEETVRHYMQLSLTEISLSIHFCGRPRLGRAQPGTTHNENKHLKFLEAY